MTMEYSISYGASTTPKIQCINPRLDKWMVRWDYQVEDEEQNTVRYAESVFMHKPELSEIKEVVISYFNEVINQNIYDFKWNNYDVYLSMENQQNYKGAYDLARDTQGANLPVVFKFGGTYDPQYHQFDTFEELRDFYFDAIAHISQKLAEGWEMKDSIDWTVYEI